MTPTPTPTATATEFIPQVVAYATLAATPSAGGFNATSVEYRITAGDALIAALIFFLLLVEVVKWFAGIIITQQ